MSRTSSFRLSDTLHERLDRFVTRVRRGKNSVIVRAIEAYLDQHENQDLAADARRQSLLARAAAHDEDWFGQAETSGWR